MYFVNLILIRLNSVVIQRSKLVDAVSNCLEQKMESDENVLIMGQDIAEYGGVFKITEGFVEKFGKERVRNTPIIESGIIGAAMGLSLNGLNQSLKCNSLILFPVVLTK